MITSKMVGGFALGFLMLGTPACGGDDDDTSVCDEAWEKHCACDNVVCDGHPTSCTGPDRERAMCLLEAEDTCTAKCN